MESRSRPTNFANVAHPAVMQRLNLKTQLNLHRKGLREGEK